VGAEHAQRFCDRCNEYVLAVRGGPNHILHLLLSILTVGLWVPIWLIVSLQVGGWRCSKCGTPVFKLFTTNESAGSIAQAESPPSGRAFPILLVGFGVFCLVYAYVRGSQGDWSGAGSGIALAFFSAGLGYLILLGSRGR
jgi:hypothetical protein